MLLPSESINNTKIALLNALQARGLTEINGDPVPKSAQEIEFGVAIDKNDLEKGWTSLEGLELDEDDAPKRGAGKKAASTSLKAVEISNGQSIAFRFRQTGNNAEDDLDLVDPGWDVIVPSLDDEEEET
ncbi:hypothetical protein BJX63DRAFT_412792 [Aspergillus granulosus]|uniref:Uncharacterized protein n=1 Tax=Aspergillus granulosus TaxID=176169 RepID=A0ABR4GW11_9EURO